MPGSSLDLWEYEFLSAVIGLVSIAFIVGVASAWASELKRRTRFDLEVSNHAREDEAP